MARTVTTEVDASVAPAVGDGAVEPGNPRGWRSLVHSRWLIASGLIACVVLAVWLAVRVSDTYYALEKAAADAESLQSAVLSGRDTEIEADARRAKEHVKEAKDAIGSIPCRIVRAIPLLGRPVDSIAQITDSVDELVNVTLPTVVTASKSLDPDWLRSPTGGLRLDALRDARPAINDALEAATAARLQATGIESALFAPPVDDARLRLLDSIDGLIGMLDTISETSELLPGLLGADGPRTYLVIFQTNAELRGTGGLVGGVGKFRVDNGEFLVDEVANNLELVSAANGLDLGAEFDNLYRTYESDRNWLNSNMSPHLPYAGQIWQHLWQEQTGERVDGVITVDPGALAYMLGAVGPVTMPDGWIVSADNVSELTMSTIYQKFETSLDARKQYQTLLAVEVISRLVQGVGSPTDVLGAVRSAAEEGRFGFWSANPAEQAVLAYTDIGHALPYSPAPYANVVINNAGGNKLDYYLDREITYSGDRCLGDRRSTKVTIEMANNVPLRPLPDYVIRSRATGIDGPIGTNRLIVSVYATWGARLEGVTIDGLPAEVRYGREQGHPVFYVVLDLEPGQESEVEFSMDEPTVAGTPQLVTQPMARPTVSVMDLSEC